MIILYFLVSFLSPYFYSYFANNLALETKDSSQVNIVSFLGTRIIGKRRGIRNIQQLFKWLLWSYLIYLVLELVIVFIVVGIGQTIEGSQIKAFIEEFKNINTMLGNEMYLQELTNLVLKYEKTIDLVSGISNFIAVSVAFYFFLYKFARSFINFYAMQGDGRFAIAPFFINKSVKRTLALKEFGYNKNFHILLLPYYIGTVVIFSACYLLMFFFLNTSPMLNSLTAMIVTVFILLPFLPVILNFNMLNSEKFRFYYLKTSSEDLTEMFNSQVSQHQFASKEEEEKFKKDFDDFNNKVQEMLNENKDKFNEDKNDDNIIDNKEDDKKDE